MPRVTLALRTPIERNFRDGKRVGARRHRSRFPIPPSRRRRKKCPPPPSHSGRREFFFRDPALRTPSRLRRRRSLHCRPAPTFFLRQFLYHHAQPAPPVPRLEKEPSRLCRS